MITREFPLQITFDLLHISLQQTLERLKLSHLIKHFVKSKNLEFLFVCGLEIIQSCSDKAKNFKI